MTKASNVIKFPSASKRSKRKRAAKNGRKAEVVKLNRQDESSSHNIYLKALKDVGERHPELQGYYLTESGTATIRQYLEELVRVMEVNLNGTIERGRRYIEKIERGEYRKGETP